MLPPAMPQAGSPQPTPMPPGRTVLPLSSDDLALWRGNLDKSRQVRKTIALWWDANLDKYAPDQSDDPEGYGEDINTNRDFTLVERKKADLFYQRPDVSLIPSPLMIGHEALTDTDTTILNTKLGREGINALALVDQVLFDVLCPSGRGWTAMGYESATVDTPTTHPETGAPLSVPVPVYEDCFWRWFSPYQGLVPHDAHTARSDDWAWIGMDFEIPVRAAKRKGWVPDDYKGGPSNKELYHDSGLSDASEAVAKGALIYYKSALYRDDRVHPLHQTMLILMDGIDTPGEHKDSPYQTLDPQGRLTPDSLIGYAIHPLTIRTLTDSAHIPSDCTISRPLVNELNKFRSQMVEFREASVLRWMYNVDTLPVDALNKIVRSPVGGFIGVPGEAFVGDGSIKELPHGSMPRESFQTNDYIDNDLARTHAIDAEQSGVAGTHDQTATEANIKQANVNSRLGRERGVVLDWYCGGVTKFATILRRFLPIADAAKIVGQQAAEEWDGWRKTIPAGLAFTAMADSALRNDVSSDRQRAMQEYTFFANDTNIDRVALLKEILPKLHYSQKVINATPPQKGPEPARISLSFNGNDLNPNNPQFAIVMELMRQEGIQVSPQAVQEAQGSAQNAMLAQHALAAQAPSGDPGHGQPKPNTTHGGKVPQMEGLAKHHAELTGAMQGTGQPSPLGPGGVQ